MTLQEAFRSWIACYVFLPRFVFIHDNVLYNRQFAAQFSYWELFNVRHADININLQLDTIKLTYLFLV